MEPPEKHQSIAGKFYRDTNTMTVAPHHALSQYVTTEQGQERVDILAVAGKRNLS